MRTVWSAIASFFRTIGISLVLVWAFLSYGFRRLFKARMKQDDKERLRGEVMAKACERLGATFIKFGQILSTRPDLLGPGYIEPLSRVQNRVKPESVRLIEKVLARELGPAARVRYLAGTPFGPIDGLDLLQAFRGRLEGFYGKGSVWLGLGRRGIGSEQHRR